MASDVGAPSSQGLSAEEANLFWIWDQVHCPRPMSPMGASVMAPLLGEGSSAAARTLGLPSEMRVKYINGYMYTARVASGPSPQAPPSTEALTRIITDLPRQWEEEYLPELLANISRMKVFDLPGASDDGLLSHLDWMMATLKRHWTIHMLTVQPVFAAGAALVELYGEVMGGDDEAGPYKLLEGLDNKTLAADRALWRLAAEARFHLEVAQLLVERAPILPQEELAAREGGRAWLASLQWFLEEYGYRNASDDIGDVTWREDPSFVLTLVKEYLSGQQPHPDERRQRLRAERDGLLEQVQRRLGRNPRRRQAFSQALANAQQVWPLREDHGYYIDQMSMALFRYAVLEGGRRLAAAGSIGADADVFYLTLEELREALASRPRPALRSLVARRRRQQQRWAQAIPPPFLGQPGPTPGGPLEGELVKFFGQPQLPDQEEAGQLKGAAGSAGVARGPARVVLGPEDLAKVQPGDVLVCVTTAAAWTPLFGVIGGLVTDSGGVLAHGAIVAREYQIPAVLGTGVGTKAIKDGQWVTVDGSAGVVTVPG
ncbi:MAG: PEP-utilizing enzyme [Dehalococcoidia bacterium]